jgi:hypothetical protein
VPSLVRGLGGGRPASVSLIVIVWTAAVPDRPGESLTVPMLVAHVAIARPLTLTGRAANGSLVPLRSSERSIRGESMAPSGPKLRRSLTVPRPAALGLTVADRRLNRIAWRVGLALLFSTAFLFLLVPAAHATLTSNNVAYVFDDTAFPCGTSGCGLNDTSFGASIFVDALTGQAPGSGEVGVYAPNNGPQVTVTNVPLSGLDANPSALSGYDTVVAYELCAIGTPANGPALSALNAFVNGGGKLLIFDADACSAVSSGPADWSHFIFPFATNSPGPQGASGSYESVEPSSLTAGLALGPQPGDAVGDANVFTTFDGRWSQAIAATNVNGVTGIVEAYARASSGGLAIYEGEDFWATFGPSTHLQQVFDDMLNQSWNPDHLPGSTSASGITLMPATQSAPIGGSATIAASVANPNGTPIGFRFVSFSVVSGPDSGTVGHDTTDSLGRAVFHLVGSGQGVDTVEATFTDVAGAVHTSNAVMVTFSGHLAHYSLELKTWIPFQQIVDPKQPISGSYLGFPPFGGVEDNCYSPSFFAQFGTVVLSTYHGDGHQGIDGTVRAMATISFDWDGHIITNLQARGSYGETQRLLDYFGPDGHHQCVADHATATKSATGGGSGNSFNLEVHSSNPLVHPSPDIDAVVNGSVEPNGDLRLQFNTDLFPSIGLRAYRNSAEIGTIIANDASCLGPNDVLGLGGAFTVLVGLTSQVNELGAVLPAAGPRAYQAHPSGLCNPPHADPIIASTFVGSSGSGRAASASLVRVAESHDGTRPSSHYETLQVAEAHGLVMVNESKGGVLITATPGKRLVISATGGARVLAIVQSISTRTSHVSRYLLPAGTATIVPAAKGGAQVRVNGRAVRPQRGAALHTVVQITKRPHSTRVLRFRVSGRIGLAATYVIVGAKLPQLVSHGRLVLRGVGRATVYYYSVDALGDVEKPHRLR